MKNSFLFILCSISLFFSACEGTKHEIVLDNPLLEDLQVTIDKETYDLIGFTDLMVELPEGENKITATNTAGEIVFDETILLGSNGIINLTGATYVVWNDLYLEDVAMFEVYAESALSRDSVVVVNEKEYNDVDFDIYEGDIFIAENWDFGLNDYWPEEVDMYGGGHSVKAKIYRVSELEEDWGYWGDWDLSDYTEEDFEGLLDSLEILLEEEEL